MTPATQQSHCIYCDQLVDPATLTDEHIWPDALGGDALPTFWRTEVCGRCNSISGVFVDGAFIKSWFGAAERSLGDDAYLTQATPENAIVPFSYIGTIPDVAATDGEVVDYWVGRCGSSVLHFRPEGEAGLWDTYAGGDPRKEGKRKTAGRAYLAMTSPVPFWQKVAISSFNSQFKRAQRFRVTPLESTVVSDLPIPDQNDSVQAGDIPVLKAILSSGQIAARTAVDPSVGKRFQAKLGLAVGYRLFGDPFGGTAYAKALRSAFRQPDPAKRAASIVRGSGFLDGRDLGGTEAHLRWLGGWVLWLKRQGTDVALIVITPSGNVVSTVVSEDPTLTSSLGAEYNDGIVWVTVPSIDEAVGPVPAPDYIAHQMRLVPNADLSALASKRAAAASLPDCGLDSPAGLEGTQPPSA